MSSRRFFVMAQTVGDVVLAHLREQRDAFHDREAQVRAGEPEGVHKMRVASRQLRSGLSTFKKVFVGSEAARVRDELGWFAGLLGAARDPEVVRLRILAEIDDEPDNLVLGEIRNRLDEDLGAKRDAAHKLAVEALDSRRFTELATSLDALLDDPPLAGHATRKAKVLRKRIGKRQAQLRKHFKVARANRPEPHDVHDPAMHEVRKSAKRLRYAAEAVTPVFGDKAAAVAELAQTIQSALGDEQDSAHTRSYLQTQSSAATAQGANAFSFGRLHLRNEMAAEEAVRTALNAGRELRRKTHTRWTR
jgi:CHAD domain-containing protein